MTLHGSKGLEFPAVLLYGAEKGRIPLESEYYETDWEEERRLLYVGYDEGKGRAGADLEQVKRAHFWQRFQNTGSQKKQRARKKQQETWHQMSLF